MRPLWSSRSNATMTPLGPPCGDAPTAEAPQDVPTKKRILAMLANLRGEGLELWRRMEAERFWSRHDRKWSPADNVHHLMISTAPVTLALRIPRLMLRVCFGVTRTPSRNWEALRSAYRDGLAAGATAGRYAPPRKAVPVEAAADQGRLVLQCEGTVLRLEKAIEPWREQDLDRYRLPHPVLGRVTVREILMFTLFHFDHHREIVARRLEASPLSGLAERIPTSA
jgi:hypothetical protein